MGAVAFVALAGGSPTGVAPRAALGCSGIGQAQSAVEGVSGVQWLRPADGVPSGGTIRLMLSFGVAGGMGQGGAAASDGEISITVRDDAGNVVPGPSVIPYTGPKSSTQAPSQAVTWKPDVPFLPQTKHSVEVSHLGKSFGLTFTTGNATLTQFAPKVVTETGISPGAEVRVCCGSGYPCSETICVTAKSANAAMLHGKLSWGDLPEGERSIYDANVVVTDEAGVPVFVYATGTDGTFSVVHPGTGPLCVQGTLTFESTVVDIPKTCVDFSGIDLTPVWTCDAALAHHASCTAQGKVPKVEGMTYEALVAKCAPAARSPAPADSSGCHVGTPVGVGGTLAVGIVAVVLARRRGAPRRPRTSGLS